MYMYTYICIYVYLFGLMNMGFPGGSGGKEPACQCRRHKRRGFNPWVGKILGVGNSNPLQYSGGLQSIGSQKVGYD